VPALRSWQVIPAIATTLVSLILASVPALAGSRSALPASAGCAPWQIVPGSAGGLVALSAASGGDVWAVGTIQAAGHNQGNIQHWDGTRWKVVPSVNSAGAETRLLGVAAISRTDAWAVGVSYASGSSTAAPLLEHWNGSNWNRIAVVGSGFSLNAIAAISSSDVWAVGGYLGASGGAVAEHWDGHAWHPNASIVQGFRGGTFNGVTAISSKDVWAAGETITNTAKPLIEHWDGHAWQSSLLPTIPDQTARFSAIAGLSDGDLWAAGFRGSGMIESGNSLLLRKDASGWHVVAGSSGPQLGYSSVAADSGRDVWAAGGTSVMHWNGAAWQASAVPAGGVTALAAVGPRDIWGVGTHFAHDTGALCAAGSMAAHTVAVPDVGTRDGGMSPLPDGPGSLVLDPARARAFVRDGNGQVTVVNSTSNTIVAKIPIDASGMMALDDQHGRLYVPTMHAGVAVLDATTGASRGTVLPASTSLLDAAFDASTGRLLVTDRSGLSIVNAAGALVATVPISSPSNLVVDSGTGHAFVSSNVVSPYPGMNVADSGTSLVAVDTMTGAVLRRVTGAGGPSVIDEKAGQVFVGYVGAGATIRVSAIAASSGKLLRTYNLGSNGDAFLSEIADDAATATVFVTTFFGLQSLDLTTGNSRVLDAAVPAAVAVDSQHARLFAAFPVAWNHYGIPVSPGEVAMIDEKTGTRQATIRVGVGPDMAAVDGRSSKAFVLDTSGLEIIDPDGTGGTLKQPAPSDAATAMSGARFFTSTHHNLSGQFLAFWQQYGGLAVLGNPSAEPFVQDAHQSQYLERALLQVVNGKVLPAPLGRVLTAGRVFAPVPAFASSAGKLYFAQTRHALSGTFLTYWKAHHGDVLLGAPISEVAPEGNGDGTGRKYATQWFVNGRLEYHPELAGTPYVVEPGLVGVQALRRQSWFT
jgi:hypothetical protein